MILGIKPVECSPHIIDFPVAVIMFALAQASSSKVEGQHRKAKTIQRLHGVEDNLVMQRPAKQRMRMTNHRSVRRIFRASVEQRLQPSRRTVESQRMNR